MYIPYSGKFLLGANFRDFRGQTRFRENINRKKMNQDGLMASLRDTSVRIGTRVNEMVLYSLSAAKIMHMLAL